MGNSSGFDRISPLTRMEPHPHAESESGVHSKDCTETNLFHFSSSFKPEYIIPLVGGGSILFGVLFYCICCRGKGRSSKWDSPSIPNPQTFIGARIVQRQEDGSE